MTRKIQKCVLSVVVIFAVLFTGTPARALACAETDNECLLRSLLEQVNRAEAAELRAKHLASAEKSAEELAAVEGRRADKAEKALGRQIPAFWYIGGGFLLGIGASALILAAAK